MILTPSKRKALQSLIHFSGENVYPDFSRGINSRYLTICDKRAIKLLLSTLQMVGILLFSNALFTILSGVAYFFYNDIQFPVPVLLPFTDLESNGLVINILNQVFVAFTAFVGLIGIEIATCILRDSIGMSTAAICYSIDEMSEKVNDPAYSRVYIDRCFRNILMQTQDLDRYNLLEHNQHIQFA